MASSPAQAARASSASTLDGATSTSRAARPRPRRRPRRTGATRSTKRTRSAGSRRTRTGCCSRAGRRRCAAADATAARVARGCGGRGAGQHLPAQRIRSASSTRNTPGRPEVPLESPTVTAAGQRRAEVPALLGGSRRRERRVEVDAVHVEPREVREHGRLVDDGHVGEPGDDLRSGRRAASARRGGGAAHGAAGVRARAASGAALPTSSGRTEPPRPHVPVPPMPPRCGPILAERGAAIGEHPPHAAAILRASTPRSGWSTKIPSTPVSMISRELPEPVAVGGSRGAAAEPRGEEPVLGAQGPRVDREPGGVGGVDEFGADERRRVGASRRAGAARRPPPASSAPRRRAAPCRRSRRRTGPRGRAARTR